MDKSWQKNQEIEIPEEALLQTLETDLSLSSRLSTFVKKSPFLVAGMFLLDVLKINEFYCF